jgi:hypothetical protein
MTVHQTAREGDHYTADAGHTWDPSIIFRVIGAIAAAVMTVIGLVAVAEVSWGDQGFDASAVNVAGLTFTPEVAVATAAAGVVALIAAAMWDVTSKLIVGVLLVAGGIVILLTDGIDTNGNWIFENGHGWLAIGVGTTLIVVAVLMQMVWTPTAEHRANDHSPLAS